MFLRIPRGMSPPPSVPSVPMGQEPDHIPLPRDPPLQSVDGYFMVSQVRGVNRFFFGVSVGGVQNSRILTLW